MKYGKTWWGEKWLDALKDIDFANRIPRGKRYANSGRVYDLDIYENSVTAKVKGQYEPYYKVELEFEKFTKEEEETILNVINTNPNILSSLLNHVLPEELYELLLKEGIEVFPKSYMDMRSYCSCPDYAPICKHIASVIHILASEIDKDPFKVFSLHGCNLLNLLEFNEKIEKVKTLDDLVLNTNFDLEGVEAQSFNDISFSNIPNLLDNIFLILDDNPVFYGKDFKDILLKNYKSFHRYVERLLIEKPNTYVDVLNDDLIPFEGEVEDYERWVEDIFLKKWENPNKWEKFHLNINKLNQVSSINTDKKDVFSKKELKHELFAFLRELEYSNINKYNYNIQFSKLLFQFAIDLISKYAFIPEFFKTPDGKYNIRWAPPIFDKEVYNVFSKFVLLAPEKLVSYKGKKIPKPNQVLLLLTVFISMFMDDFIEKGLSMAMRKETNNQVFNLFFNTPQKIQTYGNSTIDSLINQWLSKFSFNSRDYDLFLVIKGRDDGFSVDINVSINDKAPIDMRKAIRDAEGDLKAQLLKDTHLINDLLSKTGNFIEMSDDIEFNLEEFSSFFLNILPLFEIAGINIILPRELKRVFKPQINLDIKKPETTKSYLTLNDITDFDWRVAIGDDYCSPEEFKSLISDSEGLVKIANNYVILDKKEIKSLIKQINNLPSRLNQSELMQALLGGEFEGADVNIDKELHTLIDNITKIEDAEVPDNLNARLRKYQEVGYSWLVQNIKTGFGSILADDMGLGKTIQVLTTIQHFKNEGLLEKEKVLVIAPTSLLSNWKREIENFTPELKAYIYHGQDRNLKNKTYDIILTSYGLVRQDKEEFKKRKWFLVVVDEAQNIKNPLTQQSKAIKSIKSKNRIALSGTPVENRLSEYWSIFDFINKGYLHGLKKFKKEFIIPIEKNRDNKTLNNFKLITSPFILRRVKTDKEIIKDLPEKIVNDIYCNLTTEQTALYKGTLNTLLEDLKKEDGINRRGLIFKLITSLKQICNHPSQFTKTNKYEINDSGKMEALINILENIIDANEKTLIFTQYVQMGNIMKELIEEKFNIEVLFLEGSLSRKKRDQIVEKFQNQEQYKILILSLKAGGTGLNLTAAQNVIHYDLWWNPAVENQATDRAYRIGQKNNVMVYRLVTSGTFEERINTMLDEKQELAEITVGNGETFITELSQEDLQNILSLRN